jgi:hypothetical protein
MIKRFPINISIEEMKARCVCILCRKKPEEIAEYRVLAKLENYPDPFNAVLNEENTYHNFVPYEFYCTNCYVKAGMPLIQPDRYFEE